MLCSGLLVSVCLFRRPDVTALIKKEIKFSSYIRKSGRDRLQSHIWLTASSYMVQYFCNSSNIRKPFLVHDFATYPIWNSLFMRKFSFSFLSVGPDPDLHYSISPFLLILYIFSLFFDTIGISNYRKVPTHPLLIPQAHGDADQVVSYKRGLTTNQLIQRSVKTQKLITYPGTLY
jgi:hypothetical protein